MNMFENAVKNKIRFNYKGLVSVEDLWELDVQELDTIFKTLNAQKKAVTEDSLLGTKTKEDNLVTTKIEIIRYIVETKLAQAESRKNAAENKVKKDKLMEVLATKQDDKLAGLSEAKIKAMIKEL